MAKNKNLSKKDQKRLKKWAIQAGEYMVTGGVWFWSGYVIIIVLDGHIGLFWANIIGNTVGLTLNFLLERFWVFKTKKSAKLGIIAKRYIIYTVLNAYILNYVILESLRRRGIEPEIGQFIAAGFFTVWNYAWYKAWVFKGQEKPKKTRHHA
jgi:putative flippase GtrA